jgi:hypothetical protein
VYSNGVLVNGSELMPNMNGNATGALNARKPQEHRVGSVLATLVLSLALAGCPGKPEPIALIHYVQLGACRTAQTGNGPVTPPPSHAVVIFKVSTIDNTKTAVNWSFDSTALTINSSVSLQNLGGTGPVAIGAGKNVNVNALVGIIVETSNPDGSDAATTNYFLLYPRVAPAPGTIAVKDNSKQVNYPFAQDCNSIAGR